MPFLILRLSRFLRLRLQGWRLPLAVALFVFLTSWLAMSLLESGDSGIAAPGTYWWYFLVTSATVGYGDVFPSTTGGRIVGLYVIVGGIVTLTLLFTQLAAALQSIRGRRLRGVVPLDLSDHVVLLGYWPGRTERIVAELTAEGRFQVALCAWDDVPENPLPDQPAVHFVRGDLAHEDVMTRACVQRARTVVIDGRDDNETLAIAVAVDHQCQTFFGRTFGATVLALRGEAGLRVSPAWDEPVPAGSTLYYVAAGRIDGARLGV